MLNIGLISTWHVHFKGYVKELQDSGKVNLVALWDENAKKGEETAKDLGIDFVADYDEFLARTDFQSVICCSPTTMHTELLTKAAKAKKNIFTEKLLAATTEECQKLCDAIEESGVIFTISLPLRSDSKMLYAKKLVEDGALGRVTGSRMRRSHSGVSDGWLPEYWFDTAMSGGGVMMDLGAHPVYMLSFLFGAPKHLTAMSTNLFGTSSDENTIALAEFEGGILGTCETAFVTHGVPDLLEIYGTEGSLFIRGEDVELVTKSMGALGVKSAKPVNLPEQKPSPIIQFAEACIENSKTPEYLGTEDALIMTKMIEAVYISEEKGEVVKF